MDQLHLESNSLTKRVAIPELGKTQPKVVNDPGLLYKSLEDVPDAIQEQKKIQRARNELRKREEEMNYSQIESLGFSLFTTEEIDDLAVVTCTSGDYDGPGTVRDLHLGPHNESQTCETCSGNLRTCYGHYGKIIIPKLMHPLTVDIIIKVLKCVCVYCGGLRVTADQIHNSEIYRLKGNRRLEEVMNLVTQLSKTCTRRSGDTLTTPCSNSPKVYKKLDGDYKLMYKFSDSPKASEYFMNPEQIYKILDTISTEDARLMGFTTSHPRSLIIERILVIPYCTRPDLRQDDTVYPDDISSMCTDIIKASDKYFSHSTSDKEDLLKILYFRVAHYMKNEGGQYKQGNVKVYTDITSRLQGKTALIRSNIMGKRVNFAGRTVAAPGGYFRVNEIGIPEKMAVRLTRPIKVNELNQGEIQYLFESRKVSKITPSYGKYAGNTIMITDRFILENPNYQVQIGDEVERCLQDGDIVIVNRQPSLHRQSLIALYCKLIKERTIMINLSITAPLNADFDGDELNIHVPQTLEAYAEAEQLLSVQASLMNEQTNQPMIGITYNALSGAYLMTKDENTPENRAAYLAKLDQGETSELKELETKIGMMDKTIFNQILSTMATRPQFKTLKQRIQKHGMIWGTRKSLISAAFPEDFSYNARQVTVVDGVLIKGTLSKATIGRSDGSMISEMYKQLTADDVVEFMSDIQIITREYLEYHGLSVGLTDCIPNDPNFEEEVQKIYSNAEIRILSLTGESTNPIQREAAERKIAKELEIAKEATEKLVMKSLRQENNLLIMANSGAKGEPHNVSMMAAMLGQQRVNNRRIPTNMPGKRTLPIYRPGSNTPVERGFCRNSFYSGLEPDELFFHGMGGRENLTDTAINTANTGYLGHNLIKATEDVHISGDGSVRVHDNSIIQFVYGGDGFYSGELTGVEIRGTKTPFFRNLVQVADKIAAKYS